MASDDKPGDPSQRDLAWLGYDIRATAPILSLALLLTLLVLVGRWWVVDLSELVDQIGALTVFALAWAFWPFILVLLLNRTITFTYRLTDRSLLADFGFFSRPTPPIPLGEIQRIQVNSGWLARRLDVGSVVVTANDRVLQLRGVRDPKGFAERIRIAMENLGKDQKL